ncbi:MAG: superoxide dismutase [Bacteroidales bacterium]|nr:superoxide dismutase [Bacteroidales bacterium]
MPQENIFAFDQLPYTALEGAISAQTLSFHHGKHLKTYVDNMNKMLPDSGLQGLSLQDVVRQSTGALRNNAGQVLNHVMYFEQFCTGGRSMSSKMESLLVRDFGSVEAFKTEFEQKGTSLFGSGWVWLSVDENGRLVITQEKDAANPVQKGLSPLLTFDVWEHAYYLDFQNRRADYLKAMWAVVDWNVVESRL